MKKSKVSSSVRANISFYAVENGFSSFVGEGKEIKLGNGSRYAIIKNKKYRIDFDGVNNSELIGLESNKKIQL